MNDATPPRDDAPTPGSQDPVDIAMETVADEPDQRHHARRLLKEQRHLVREEIRRLGRMRWRDVIVTAFGAILLGLTVYFITNAAASKAVVVEAFDVPPALAEDGLSGPVMAGAIQDAIVVIQRSNVQAALRRNIDNAWTDNIEVVVPAAGVSVGDIDRMLRRNLSDETYVSGALVREEDGSLSLTVRANGVPAATFTGTRAELPDMATKAAEYVYSKFEPRLYARYLLTTGRIDELEGYIEGAYADAPEDYRSDLASTWSTLLRFQGDHEGALLKNETALELDPENWNAAHNMVSRLQSAGKPREAIRFGEQLLERLEAKGGELDPDVYLTNYYALRRDYAGVKRAILADLEESGGKGAFINSDSNLVLAEIDAALHDFEEAERRLSTVASGDEKRYTQLSVDALRLMDEGRWVALGTIVGEMEGLWLSNKDVLMNSTAPECDIAGQYFTAFRYADVQRLIEHNDSRFCSLYSSILAMVSANRSVPRDRFDAMLEESPIDPAYPWEIGNAYLRVRDFDAARHFYEMAAERGPDWADPHKGLGDVAFAQERYEDAITHYDRALELAPTWKQARTNRERVLERLAR